MALMEAMAIANDQFFALLCACRKRPVLMERDWAEGGGSPRCHPHPPLATCELSGQRHIALSGPAGLRLGLAVETLIQGESASSGSLLMEVLTGEHPERQR